MKKLFIFTVFVFAALFIPSSSYAQSTGQWVPCLDPGGSGQLVSCFVPHADQRQMAPSVINNVSQQVVVIVNQPAVEQSRNRRNRAYRSNETSQAPYWESQQRTTSRRTYGGGIDRWTGRSYGNFEYQTETVTVRAEANSLTFRPTISIGPSYWPSYRGW